MKSSVFCQQHSLTGSLYRIGDIPRATAAARGRSRIFLIYLLFFLRCFFYLLSPSQHRNDVMKAESFYSLHVLLALRHNKPPKKNNQERNWITGFVFFLKFSRSSHVWLVEPSNGCSKYWMPTSWSTRPFHNSRPLIHILVPVFSFLL